MWANVAAGIHGSRKVCHMKDTNKSQQNKIKVNLKMNFLNLNYIRRINTINYEAIQIISIRFLKIKRNKI